MRGAEPRTWDCPCDFKDGDKLCTASRRPIPSLWGQEHCPRRAGWLILLALPLPFPHTQRPGNEAKGEIEGWGSLADSSRTSATSPLPTT